MGRKKLMTVLKLQIPAGQASPAPPVGPALGQHGVNIGQFVQQFNAQTGELNGMQAFTTGKLKITGDMMFSSKIKRVPLSNAWPQNSRTNRMMHLSPA